MNAAIAIAALALTSLSVASCSTGTPDGDPTSATTSAPEASDPATVEPSQQTSFPVEVAKPVQIIVYADAANDCVNANKEFGGKAISITYGQGGPEIAQAALAATAARDGEDCVLATTVTYTAEEPGEYAVVSPSGSGSGTNVLDPAEIYRLFNTTTFTYHQSSDGSWTSCAVVSRESCLSLD